MRVKYCFFYRVDAGGNSCLNGPVLALGRYDVDEIMTPAHLGSVVHVLARVVHPLPHLANHRWDGTPRETVRSQGLGWRRMDSHKY